MEFFVDDEAVDADEASRHASEEEERRAEPAHEPPAQATQSPAVDERPQPAAKKARGPQVKRWAFTYNNFPRGWSPRTFCNGDVAYCVWQTERGAEGTVHIQGYVRFNSRKSMQTVKNFFEAERMHVEPAVQPEHTNTLYCTKAEGRVEEGTRGTYGTEAPHEGEQGRRSDLAAIAEKAKAGVTIKDIADQHPVNFIRYHGGIQALVDQVGPAPPIARVVSCYVLWGPTGVGKTHRVLTSFLNVYQVLGRGRDPWGNYAGQDVLLLDEFDWRLWSPQEMNCILDKWRYRLDCRYRDKYANWTYVFICCNDNPNEWFSNTSQALRDAVRRRLASSCRYIGSQEPSLAEVRAQDPEPNWAPQH